MLERAKSRWILVAVVGVLLLSAFMMGKVDADSDPPFIVLWGESDIKAVTYHPESGQYCVETEAGSISCGCKCIIDDTCDDGETVLEEDTPTPGETPGPSQTPTKEPTQTPEPTPTPTETPTEESSKTQPQNCNNGVGNGSDCPPPGHDKDNDGVADSDQGDNDDDNENRPCGEPGNPCNKGEHKK